MLSATNTFQTVRFLFEKRNIMYFSEMFKCRFLEFANSYLNLTPQFRIEVQERPANAIKIVFQILLDNQIFTKKELKEELMKNYKIIIPYEFYGKENKQ